MRVAIPVSRERVSPVFDTARLVEVVEFEGRREANRFRIELKDKPPLERVRRLVSGGVNVLLCGAVSRPLLNMLRAGGVKTVPFLAGDVGAVLKAFLDDRLADQRFQMPGCCRRRQQRRRCAGDRKRGGGG